MEFAGDATLMFYLMEEAQEGKNAFLEKRDPDFKKFPRFPKEGKGIWVNVIKANLKDTN